MASASQIRKIHTLKSMLGLDEDLYREMLSSFDVQTSKNLTFTEAGIFIEILEEKAVVQTNWQKHPQKYSQLNRDEEMATPAQLRMIEGIWREVCYFDSDKYAKSSLRKLLKSKFKIDDIMFLTKAKAAKVIQCVLAIKKNLKKSAATL